LIGKFAKLESIVSSLIVMPLRNHEKRLAFLRFECLTKHVRMHSEGFLIYIDFVKNLRSEHVSARVITCLHHVESGLGEPSILPAVACQSYYDEGEGHMTSIALVSTKQPVPQCPAHSGLTLIIELQMAFKNDDHSNARQTPGQLNSCAWTKLPLFNTHNQLLGGRWRTNWKQLPIDSEISLTNLKSMPNVSIEHLLCRRDVSKMLTAYLVQLVSQCRALLSSRQPQRRSRAGDGANLATERCRVRFHLV
jgi:hypothetical protein